MFTAASGYKYRTAVGMGTVYGQYIIWQLHTVLLRVVMRYVTMEGLRCSAVELRPYRLLATYSNNIYVKQPRLISSAIRATTHPRLHTPRTAQLTVQQTSTGNLGRIKTVSTGTTKQNAQRQLL